jgi:hypothetical protein
MSPESEVSQSQTKTSTRSTSNEKPAKVRDIVATKDGVSATERAAAQLELQLEKEKTERKQERFFWMMGAGTLVGVLASGLGHGATLIFTIFFLLFLLALAKWLEVDWIIKPLSDVLRRFLPKNRDTENSETF